MAKKIFSFKGLVPAEKVAGKVAEVAAAAPEVEEEAGASAEDLVEELREQTQGGFNLFSAEFAKLQETLSEQATALAAVQEELTGLKASREEEVAAAVATETAEVTAKVEEKVAAEASAKAVEIVAAAGVPAGSLPEVAEVSEEPQSREEFFASYRAMKESDKMKAAAFYKAHSAKFAA